MSNERQFENECLANAAALDRLTKAAQSIKTDIRVLSRVAYWDRAFLRYHKCHCDGVRVEDELGHYYDRSLCRCFPNEPAHYGEYRKQWIALRALVPSHAIERLIDEATVLYDLAERTGGYALDLDYTPGTMEMLRVRTHVEAHEEAITESLLSAAVS